VLEHAITAICLERHQLGAQLTQLLQSRIDVDELLSKKITQIGAGFATGITQRQDLLNLPQREPEGFRLHDKAQAIMLSTTIEAIPGRISAWSGEEANGLVVSDRLCIKLQCCRELTDAQRKSCTVVHGSSSHQPTSLH
jgi:hypothetical protein